jgi:ArsR family transcriptional regulator
MAVGLADLMRAAGEPTRIRLLNLLRRGTICVCDLQAVLGLPQPTVSRHLAALRHAGLVRDSREGPRVLYSLVPATSNQLRLFHQFLGEACRDEALLQQDLEALDRALQAGECVVLERKDPGSAALHP